jgi:hypothetical protein
MKNKRSLKKCPWSLVALFIVLHFVFCVLPGWTYGVQRLAWDYSDDPSCEGFNVYRGYEKGEYLFKDPIQGCEAREMIIMWGSGTYSIAMTAFGHVNGELQESTYSNEIYENIWGPAPGKPGTPTYISRIIKGFKAFFGLA